LPQFELQMANKLKSTVRATRTYRKIHKWLAVPLFLFMFFFGTTGFLLGWKKQTNLLPPTQKGAQIQADKWLTIDSLQQIAVQFAEDSLHRSGVIDRIDIRPQKGIAKFIFENHFTELQIDCSTGEVLSVGQKTSDIIEKIHDGSIIDYFIKVDQDPFKLAYTTMASLGLVLLSISGFWMWYNPKRIKKMKQQGE
jgi:hypothetical protein